MRAIRGKNTAPELLVRKALHALGFRFRLHRRDLPGKPDLALPKFSAVVFVHGCFWHKHDCYRGRKEAAENREFWKKKIAGNVARDHLAIARLAEKGWRVATVWECALTGKERLGEELVARKVADWLQSDATSLEVRGDPTPRSLS